MMKLWLNWITAERFLTKHGGNHFMQLWFHLIAFCPGIVKPSKVLFFIPAHVHTIQLIHYTTKIIKICFNRYFGRKKIFLLPGSKIFYPKIYSTIVILHSNAYCADVGPHMYEINRFQPGHCTMPQSLLRGQSNSENGQAY